MGVYATDAAAAWCGGYTWDDDNGTANLKCSLLLGSDVPVVPTSSSTSDRCAKMTTVKAFADLAAALNTAWANVTNTLYTNLIAATDAQAALEKTWLQAWYEQQYWAALKTHLTTSDSGLTATSANTNAATARTETLKLADSGTADDLTVSGAEAFTAGANTSLTNATEQLATLQAATTSAAAAVAALGTRITRSTTQIAELLTLASGDSSAPGELDDAAVLRTAEHSDYTNDGTNGDPKGEAVLAAEELAAANAAVAAAAGADPEGPLRLARTQAQQTWTAAQGTASDAEGALTAALSGAVLVDLRATVVSDKADWDAAQGTLDDLVVAVAGAEDAVTNAQDALDAAVLACQIKAYDAYRTTLEEALVQRADDLKAIKALMATELKVPAPGTAGARCEKALSNGTYRPARGEMTCAEGLCCGAARVWMEAGTTADAAWRTVETCQSAEATTYSFQPPRAPMATTMPSKVDVDFVCIEGAKKLAAAASAVAAAVYMLA